MVKWLICNPKQKKMNEDDGKNSFSNCIDCTGVLIDQVGRSVLIGQERARQLLTCAREAIDITRVSNSGKLLQWFQTDEPMIMRTFHTVGLLLAVL